MGGIKMRNRKWVILLLVVSILLPNVVFASPADNQVSAFRLAGSSRIQTSIEVCKEVYGTAGTVILTGANGGEVDALAGTLLASAKKAPILITLKDKVHPDLRRELKRLNTKNIIILGGELAVDQSVEDELGKDYFVKRIYGKNREATAAAIAKETISHSNSVFLAKGYGVLADALTIGPVSGLNKTPVLLTNGDEVSTVTLTAMKELGVTEVILLGGELAIKSSVEEQLKDYKVKRISGATREGTALAIAETFFEKPENAIIANGYTYADALVGGYLGVINNSPILLAKVNEISTSTLKFMGKNTKKVFVLGGDSVISGTVFTEIHDTLIRESEAQLKIAQESAIIDLESYVDLADYTINKKALVEAITNGKLAIYEASSERDVLEAFNATKEIIDAIETDQQINNKAAARVEDLIEALPALEEFKLTDKKQLQEARAAYELLTPGQQALVTNLDKLKALEAKEKEIEKDVELTKAIAAAEKAIAELSNEITIADKQAVVDARKLVEVVLAIDDQAVIKGLDKLESAEKTLIEIEQRILVQEINISGESLIVKGDQIQLEAKISPEQASMPQVIWSVQNNSGVAIINQAGLVEAIEAGKITVIASSIDGSGIYARKTVDVALPVTIKGYTGNGETLEIPNIIEGNKLTNGQFKGFEIKEHIESGMVGVATQISDFAFADKSLKKVEISSNITEIGQGAFLRNEITEVVISDSVRSLGAQAFADNKLSHVVISNNLKEIKDYTFANNLLKDVVIPNGITVIGKSAFEGRETGAKSADGLTKIRIPKSVLEIKDRAFRYNSLLEVVIPDTVAVIGESAFAHNALKQVSLSKGLSEINSYAFAHNQLTEIKLPESIQKIGVGAFNQNKLERLELNEGLTEIEALAFHQNKLGTLSLPKSMIKIGTQAFEGNHLKRVDILGNVTLIGTRAFANNQITDLELAEGIKTIGKEAFQNNQLVKLEVANSVTRIGEKAFANNQISKLTMGLRVIEIGDSAFEDNHLSQIVIPGNVKKIGNKAFYKNKLADVTILDGTLSIGARAFKGIESKVDVGNVITSLEIPDSVIEIGAAAFYGNKLSSVKIPNRMSKIEEGTFKNNEIKDLTLPANLIEIGESAFENNKLNNVLLPDSLHSIGKKAFQNNYLKNLRISYGLTEIGELAFSNNQLVDVKLPASLNEISDRLFKNNYLKSLEIPDGITKIGEGAFENNQLAFVSLPDSLIHISLNAFRNNELSQLMLPSKLEIIGEESFGNNRLTSIRIPNSVIEIRGRALINNNITKIVMPDHVLIYDDLLALQNNQFRGIYLKEGKGTYIGSQTGQWVKLF